MSRTALDAMLPAMEENYGNPSSLHSVGQRAAELLMKSRETVARCLNCQPREIIFTSGGSEADNQALLSAAAIGCNVELDDHPGYFPLNNDKNMAAVMKEAMETVAGPDSVVEGGWGTGSTDMGDVSAIMPVLHPHANGSIGTGHGKDYYVQDKKLGCLYPAECLVLTAAKLLADDAALGKKVIAEAKPYFKSKDEYLAAIDAITMDKDAVVYNEDGTITLNFTK
jgi:hypothetical protein